MVLIVPVPKKELSVNEVFREWKNKGGTGC